MTESAVNVPVHALSAAPWNPRSIKDERFQNDGSRGGRNLYEAGPTEPACDPASRPVRVLADRIPSLSDPSSDSETAVQMGSKRGLTGIWRSRFAEGARS
jgi:hypothetical protein